MSCILRVTQDDRLSPSRFHMCWRYCALLVTNVKRVPLAARISVLPGEPGSWGIFLHMRASWNIIASDRVLRSRPASTGTDQWPAFTDNSIHDILNSKRSLPHHFCIWFYYCSEGQHVSSLVYDGALLAAAAICYLNIEKIYAVIFCITPHERAVGMIPERTDCSLKAYPTPTLHPPYQNKEQLTSESSSLYDSMSEIRHKYM